MKFEKISTPSLKILFINKMENMILSGELEIGEKLPPERELAESMQVSRAIINAGINEMAAKGFLEIRPRIGTFVGDYRRTGTIETLLSIMKYNGGHLRRDEVRSMLEIKLVIDSLAAKLAINKNSAIDLSALKTLLLRLENSTTADDAAYFVFAFYHELAILSGNTLLPLIYYSFRVPVLSLWERFARMHGINSLYENTQKLYVAIENKQLSEALSCLEMAVGESIKGEREIYYD